MSFRIWSKQFGEFDACDLATDKWEALQKVAGFVGVTGCRAHYFAANDDGIIYLIDTCDKARQVPPTEFCARFK